MVISSAAVACSFKNAVKHEIISASAWQWHFLFARRHAAVNQTAEFPLLKKRLYCHESVVRESF
jgi:hypothetical protein